MSAGLSILPPSPPTTTSRKHTSLSESAEKKRTLDDSKALGGLKDPPLNTPGESPASFPGSGSMSGKSRKKVEFSPWTNIHNAPDFTTTSPSNVAVRPLLPSRELSSSASILKTSQPDYTPQAVEDEPQPEVGLVEMLESITQQLSRNDVAESIDAYQTLSSTLKAYSQVPDAQTLKSKLGSLMQHIRRDLAILDKSENIPAEINLATQTLKVLVILAWNRNFSMLLNNEIQVFILDRAIHVVAEHKAPKGVILHYLRLLATQDFRHSNVSSNGRVGRLLDALKDLTKHVKGNGAVSERLMVYQRLLEQGRPQMKAKPLSWVHDLLDGLTAVHRETRTKAIELGTKAVAVFPSSTTVAHALQTILDMKLDDGKTVGIVACKRLEKMLANKDDGLFVPQIWAIVLSLMKGLGGGIDRWSSLREWLKVMQRCFNSGNSAIRAQANIAWTRFIYVACPSEATQSLLGMLIKPIAPQMERKGMEREERSSRATAFSAYCTLLYYSFRPSASHKQYDRVWEEYVLKFMNSSFLENASVAADRVCRIFMALFWNDNSRNKLWREIRAQEHGLMEPEELPTINCKWIRSKSSSILDIFKLLVQNSSWGSEDQPHQSYVATAWKHMSKALGAACRKEMKPSGETMQALGNILAFLGDTWRTGPSALNAVDENFKDAFIIRYRFICLTILAELGGIPLVEGNLPADCVKGLVRTGAARESAPITQFVSMLTSVNESVIPNQAYYEFVKEVLLLPRKARIPTRQRICLLRQIAVFTLDPNPQTPTSAATAYIWQAIASAVKEEIEPASGLENLQSDIENVLQDVAGILEIGITYSPGSTSIWCGLLRSLVGFATHSKSQSAANVPSIAIPLMTRIEQEASYGLTMEIAELIQCVLPSIELSMARTSPRQPKPKLRTKTTVVMSPFFDKLLFLLNGHLKHAYSAWSSERLPGISSIVDATCLCLRSCPSELLVYCLQTLESSLCLWLQDSHRLLMSTTSVGAVKQTAERRMCSLLIDILGQLSENDDALEQLGNLFAAGFRSTHKLTINRMVEMWNRTFGLRTQLTYPEQLQAALDRLRPFVDLELPSFGINVDNASMVEVPSFAESQDEDTHDRSGFTKSSNCKPKSTGARSLMSPSPGEARVAVSPELNREPEQSIRERTPVAVSSKPKRRHDDSQILYVAIDSSPLQHLESESQHLTERQKEVWARRQAEPAVVFPDLRTSSLTGNGLLKAPRNKNLSLGLKQNLLVEDEEPATPTLPMHANDEGDDAMVSSPTPQSKQLVLRLDDIEVPSSPPSIPGVAGCEASSEFGSSHGFAPHATGLIEGNADALVYDKSSDDDEAPRNFTDGVASAAGNGKPAELDSPRYNEEANSQAMADDEAEEHLPEPTTSLSAGDANPDMTMASKNQLATIAALDITVADMSHYGHSDFENRVGDGDVMKSLEACQEDALHQLTIPSDAEKQHQDVDERSIIQNGTPIARNETKDKYQATEGESLVDIEMTGTRSCGVTAANQVENDKPIAEDLRLEKDSSNISASGGDIISEGEANHVTAFDDSEVLAWELASVTPESHPDSDDVDNLSASQLSQDLDWHVAFEGCASLAEISSEAEGKPVNRKRKRSSGHSTPTKRRKGYGSPIDSRHPLTAGLPEMPGQAKDAEEIFDCIVVDTTPPQHRAAHSVQPSQVTMHSHEGNKKRGRKPKQLHDALQHEVTVNAGAASINDENTPDKEAAFTVSVKSRTPSDIEAAPTISREGGGDNLLREGADLGSQRPIDSHLPGSKPAVSLMIENVSLASAVAADRAVRPVGWINKPQTDDPTNLHTLLDGQGTGLAPDVADPAASPTTQHSHLPPDDCPLQSISSPAGPLEEIDVPANSGGNVYLTNDAAADEDIIRSLQQVLKHLKSARMGRAALREVEDLLFEIRTEAQHAVERRVPES